MIPACSAPLPLPTSLSNVWDPRRLTKGQELSAQIMSSMNDMGAAVALRAPEELRKRLNPRLRPAQNERVDIVSTFVGIHHLEIDDVANHSELVRYAVAAQHIARRARHIQRLATGISFHDGGDLHRRRAIVLHAPE